LLNFSYLFQVKPLPIDTHIPHIRPRFKIAVPHPQEQLMERLGHMVKNAADPIRGHIVDHHIILDIVGKEAHYWSPQLNFRIEADEEDPTKSVVSGLIGPKPNVWTMFVFIYFLIGIIGFFLSSYGISKWMLDDYSPFIWGFPIALLFILSAYFAGKYGEQLGADQIEMLKQFVRDAVYF
jgi:hypothetical protein